MFYDGKIQKLAFYLRGVTKVNETLSYSPPTRDPKRNTNLKTHRFREFLFGGWSKTNKNEVPGAGRGREKPENRAKTK